MTKKQLFISLKELQEETGLPMQRIYEDVRSGKLPANKIGTRYYVFTDDASKYTYSMICKTRGVNPDTMSKYYNKMINSLLGGIDNDKPKDQS